MRNRCSGVVVLLLLVGNLFIVVGGGSAPVNSKISMGKRDGSRAKSHRISCRGQLGGVHTELRVGYWNCNGIKDESKQQDIVDAMEKGHLNVMFVDETHLKRGGNEDMSAFRTRNPMFIERGFGLKKGGGKLVLTSKRLKWAPWDSSHGANEWIGSE